MTAARQDDGMGDLEQRLREAEEIIRAQNRKIQDMYDTDAESAWSRDADELQGAYEARYGVNLDGDAKR